MLLSQYQSTTHRSGITFRSVWLQNIQARNLPVIDKVRIEAYLLEW